jgi:hypothetical protein
MGKHGRPILYEQRHGIDVLGLVVHRGLSFSPMEARAQSSTIGTFDAVVGVEGTADGYSLIKFPDGSELWFKYTGTAKTDAKGQITLKGTAIVVAARGDMRERKGMRLGKLTKPNR